MKQIHTGWFAILLITLLCLPPRSTGVPETETIVLQGATYQVGFDGATGRLAFVRGAEGRQNIWGTPLDRSVWRLRFRDGHVLSSQQVAIGHEGRLVVERPAPDRARFVYTAPAARVIMEATARDEAVDLDLRVENPVGDIVGVDAPASLGFAPGSVRRVLFPNDLGIALKSGFFRRQSDPAIWREERVGPEALRKIAGFDCELHPVSDPPAPVTATEAGKRLLGAGLVAAWQALPRVVNRPPTVSPDLPLLTTPRGALLGGHRVGRGMLLRFAGRLPYAQGPLAMATVRQALGALHRGEAAPTLPVPERKRRKVVLVALSRGPAAGGWSEPRPEEWERVFVLSPWFRDAGLETATAWSVRQMQEALRDPDTFAIINPYGEALPIGDLSAGATLEQVRRFLEEGGVWVETGGYPFYFALRSSPYMELRATSPVQFADFVHIESEAGESSLFSVQPDGAEGTIFVPSELRATADDEGGLIERTWKTYVRKGATWQAPTLRLLVGAQAPDALHTYAQVNGLTRPLEEKVQPNVLARWKRSVLVNYDGGVFDDQIRMLSRLPSPSTLFVSDFLHGGFDRELPDHLPPNPRKGTPEQFRKLFDMARSLGHLIAPYTNVTWWGDDPRGPTFARQGDSALLRDLDGHPVREQYGPNGGWAVSPWHAAVRAASDALVQAFTHDYPADILFQDQVGARGWIWNDTNPASPAPYAYQQGLVDLSRRTAQRVPVATEHGFDRLLNVQTQFRGLTWQLVPGEKMPDWLASWLRLYRDWIGADDWEFYPLAQMMAEGRVLFAHHGGYPFVANREILAWSVALGYQLSAYITPDGLADDSRRQWLLYLDRVQKSVASRYMGRPLRAFRYLAGSGASGVMELVFDGVRVVTNLTDRPYATDGVEIAPQGFYAVADGMEAGILTRYGGRRYDDGGLWLVRDQTPEGQRVTAYTASAREVAVPAERDSRWSAGPAGAALHATGERLTVALAPDHAQAELPLPAGQVAAPARRADPPRYVGVLRLSVPDAWYRPWSDMTPERWIAAVAQSAPAREGKLQARPIERESDLLEALSRPDRWLAIVNPYAEHLPLSEHADRRTVLEAVRGYVRRGGAWMEVAGYPFFYDAIRRDGNWARTAGLADGLGLLGLGRAEIREVFEPPLPVVPTAEGRRWLGGGLAPILREWRAAALRPPVQEDYEVALLRTTDGAPLLVGHQLNGWGWFFRFCGGQPDPRVALPIFTRWIEGLWNMAPRRLRARPGAWELRTVELKRT